jgi:phosphohistidine phosphatase
MALYLVQHGKNQPKEVDPEKGLSAEGRAEVERIAAAAMARNIRVAQIRHSTKTRARQTAAIFQTALKQTGPMQEMEGIKPLDDVKRTAGELSAEQNLMLVGHLPFMERLTSFLITGSSEKRVIKFQNGGIVCLDKEPETGHWFIKWTLMPHFD